MSFIKLDTVSPQKLNELLLKRPGLVMFVLMFEVPYDIRGGRRTHGKGCVSGLPLKRRGSRESLVYPLG